MFGLSFKTDREYRYVQDGEDLESIVSASDGKGTVNDLRRNSLFYGECTNPRLPVIVASLLLLGVVFMSGWLIGRACLEGKGLDSTCITRLSTPTPVLDKIDVRVHNVTYEGSFLNENIFRQPASPEVDAAWEGMGINYRSIRVDSVWGDKLDWKQDHVRISPKYGGGYPANVEGLHHLHCLNLLRQSLYYNYDYYHTKGAGAFKNDDHVVQKHVSHCLDIIRQQLMCQPDTGVLGQIWWDPEDPKPFVDFNTVHKCKNFDSLREWAEGEQLPESVPGDFLEPPKEGSLIYDAIP